MFDILEADIVVMQETKIQRKDLRDDMVLVPGWDCYFSLPKYKKGLFFFPSRPEDRYSHGKHTDKSAPGWNRILWGCYLHQAIRLCSSPGRRRRHGLAAAA